MATMDQEFLEKNKQKHLQGKINDREDKGTQKEAQARENQLRESKKRTGELTKKLRETEKKNSMLFKGFAKAIVASKVITKAANEEFKSIKSAGKSGGLLGIGAMFSGRLLKSGGKMGASSLRSIFKKKQKEELETVREEKQELVKLKRRSSTKRKTTKGKGGLTASGEIGVVLETLQDFSFKNTQGLDLIHQQLSDGLRMENDKRVDEEQERKANLTLNKKKMGGFSGGRMFGGSITMAGMAVALATGVGIAGAKLIKELVGLAEDLAKLRKSYKKEDEMAEKLKKRTLGRNIPLANKIKRQEEKRMPGVTKLKERFIARYANRIVSGVASKREKRRYTTLYNEARGIPNRGKLVMEGKVQKNLASDEDIQTRMAFLRYLNNATMTKTQANIVADSNSSWPMSLKQIEKSNPTASKNLRKRQVQLTEENLNREVRNLLLDELKQTNRLMGNNNTAQSTGTTIINNGNTQSKNSAELGTSGNIHKMKEAIQTAH